MSFHQAERLPRHRCQSRLANRGQSIFHLWNFFAMLDLSVMGIFLMRRKRNGDLPSGTIRIAAGSRARPAADPGAVKICAHWPDPIQVRKFRGGERLPPQDLIQLMMWPIARRDIALWLLR